jgi:hypothetical protein
MKTVETPIPKVDPLDHHGIPFVMADAGDRLEHIFDVSMTPVFTLNRRDGGNI